MTEAVELSVDEALNPQKICLIETLRYIYRLMSFLYSRIKNRSNYYKDPFLKYLGI